MFGLVVLSERNGWPSRTSLSRVWKVISFWMKTSDSHPSATRTAYLKRDFVVVDVVGGGQSCAALLYINSMLPLLVMSMSCRKARQERWPTSFSFRLWRPDRNIRGNETCFRHVVSSPRKESMTNRHPPHEKSIVFLFTIHIYNDNLRMNQSGGFSI